MSGDNLVYLNELRKRAKLAGGGGGGDDDDMLERRVAALEADMREVKGSLARIEKLLERMEAKFERFDERLRKVEIDVAGLRERAAATPTHWTLFMAILGTVLTVTGLTFAVVRIGLR